MRAYKIEQEQLSAVQDPEPLLKRKKYIPWEHNKFKTSLAQIYLRGAQ